MKKKTRTRLYLERHQVTVVRTASREVESYCPVCSRPVRMLAAKDAAANLGLETSAVYELVGNNSVHFIETADGMLLICFESLCQGFSVPKV